MKKIIYNRIFIVALIIFFSACNETELDLAPITEAASDNFYKTESDIEQAVIASYASLQLKGQYGEGYPFYMEVRSDNSFEESLTNENGQFGDFDVFRLSASNPVIRNTWVDCFAGIQSCNVVLNRIDNIDMDASLKAIRKAEVKFVRALTYFNMVRIFGDVPLVLTETTNAFESFSQGRAASSEVYTQIIKDLSEASTDLPATQTETGRATKGAAEALLGKAYLTLGQFGEALTALNTVNGYSLLPNYEDIFKISNTGNNEVIFQVMFRKGINGGEEGSPFANLFASTGAVDAVGGVGQTKGSNQASTYLVNVFEAGDLRFDAALGEFNGLYYTKKYMDTPAQNFDADANLIVLRYADVLLMQAEAMNEQGYVADGPAFDKLNEVRDRAGLADLTSADIPDQAVFRLAIEQERRIELSHENHRWFDLIRTGRALEVMNVNNMSGSETYSVSSNQLLFPIPQSEIDTNPGVLGQNPGYE